MSRIAVPASKISRTLLESQRSAGAALMPKYDELLRSRLSTRSPEQSESSRGLTTAHRPTPQPSIANRTKPLMQTFHSSAPSRAPAGNLDSTVLPPLHTTSFAAEAMPRMPLLPDNYSAFHAEAEPDAAPAHATIVAANPDAVVPGAPLADLQGVTIDGVELKFAHERSEARDDSTMLSDIWRGMVDDVIGDRSKSSTN